MRSTATCLLLPAFLAACTRQVARPPVETRHFAVNWEQLPIQRVEREGWIFEGVPLTPAQWPLEASLKRLMEADFQGMIDHFDIAFHSGSLEGEVLEDLFDEGFLPVYTRVTRTGAEPGMFLPDFLVLNADGDTIFFVARESDMPTRYREIDWQRAGVAVALAALVLVVVILSQRNPGRVNLRVMGNITTAPLRSTSGGRSDGVPARPGTDPGILRAVEMAPGDRIEGFLFYRIDQGVTDWTTVRLSTP